MDFIFMLTRGDKTVEDCVEVLDQIAPLGLRHIGFKDVGVGDKPDDVIVHCAAFRAAGCAGADLLAYRTTEAEPLELIRAARRGLGDGYLIVAGSIASRERIGAVSEAGADAFTIGTAMFDGSYNPRKGSLLSQLGDVVADCEAA